MNTTPATRPADPGFSATAQADIDMLFPAYAEAPLPTLQPIERPVTDSACADADKGGCWKGVIVAYLGHEYCLIHKPASRIW